MVPVYPSRHPWLEKRLPEGEHTLLIVGGTRTFDDFRRLERVLDIATFFAPLVTVVTGSYGHRVGNGTAGADYHALRWASKNWWPIRVYEADWYGRGKAAGPIRNREMVRACGPGAFLVAFWDGSSPGTASLLEEARKVLKPKRIKVVRCG